MVQLHIPLVYVSPFSCDNIALLSIFLFAYTQIISEMTKSLVKWLVFCVHNM